MSQKRLLKKEMEIQLDALKKVQELLDSGDTEGAADVLRSRIDDLTEKTEESEHAFHGNHADKLLQMENAETIYKDDFLELRPINTLEMAEDYAAVRQENFIILEYIDTEELKQLMVEEAMDDQTLYCGIYSSISGAFTGYCGINDIYNSDMELAVEILKAHQRQGYAYNGLRAFMDAIKTEIGNPHFIVKVDPGNHASQRLMTKLGFKPAGIDTFLPFDEEQLNKIEEESLDQITDDLIPLAEVFGVEPRKLLTHVLVYEVNV